jgi:hypothetical protein
MAKVISVRTYEEAGRYKDPSWTISFGPSLTKPWTRAALEQEEREEAEAAALKAQQQNPPKTS